MTSSQKNLVANQFIVTTEDGVYFQSYNDVVAYKDNQNIIYVAEEFNASPTTIKYLSLFLEMDRDKVEFQIKNKIFKIVDLKDFNFKVKYCCNKPMFYFENNNMVTNGYHNNYLCKECGTFYEESIGEMDEEEVENILDNYENIEVSK